MILFNVNRYRFLFKICILLLCYFYSVDSYSQKAYIRVSPRDCINCYLGFFNTSLNYKQKDNIQYIFPEDFEGKRFENFNELYFHKKIGQQQVIFSDSLYNETKKPLNGLSGLVIYFKGKVIMALTAENAVGIDFRKYVDAALNLKELSDFQKEGISPNVQLAVDFENNNLAVSDFIFRKLSLYKNDRLINKIDLKTDDFQTLLKKFLTDKEFKFHKENYQSIKDLGKNYPEYFWPEFSQGNLYLHYLLPYIRKGDDKENEAIVPSMNLVSKIPFSSKIKTSDIIEHSFQKDKNPNTENYSEFLKFFIYKKQYLVLNLLQGKTKSNDLFTAYKFNKTTQNLQFDHFYQLKNKYDSIYSLLSQPNKTTNNIAYSYSNGQVILWFKPYSINLKNNTVHKLDWQQKKKNDTYLYGQIQLWKNNGIYSVLGWNKINRDPSYFIKNYDSNWDLISETELPFYLPNVKGLLISKKNIYVRLQNRLLILPNFILDSQNL